MLLIADPTAPISNNFAVRPLTCAGGDCKGLFSSSNTCSCFISLKQMGITSTLLQEKSNFTKGRSTSSKRTGKKKKKNSESNKIKWLNIQKNFCLSGNISFSIIKIKLCMRNIHYIYIALTKKSVWV